MIERQWVTIGLFTLTAIMLGMAQFDKSLWEVKLFEVLIQAVVLTGLLSNVTGFHFTANKQAEQASANTGKAFDAIAATASAAPQGPIEAVVTNDPDHPIPVEQQP